MFVVLFLLVLSILVAFFLYLLCFFISFKLKFWNKMSAFESGFNSMGLVHLSFSIHFFMVCLMFVIFDLELILLVGCLVSVNVGIFFVIMLLVLGGIYLEWFLGKLKWMV